MTIVTVHTLNAFATQTPGGNPAGIVYEADHLTAAQMQEIAKQVGFSETAFISASPHADFGLRYFTPNEEVDLCGHATVAAFVWMTMQQLIQPGRYTIHTGAGLLETEVRENGEAFSTQASPIFGTSIEAEPIAAALGMTTEDLDNRFPIQIVSTGLLDLMVGVRSEDVLASIQPNFEAITVLSRLHGVVGIHAFATHPRSGATAVCRNFAPLYDIPEESATGTANGALACYLHHYGALDTVAVADSTPSCLFEQGDTMGLPSRIYAELILDDTNQVTAVRVGGSASGVGMREIQL